MQAPYIAIGEIVRPQGIRGEVKLRAESGDADFYARLQSAYLLQGDEYVPVRVLHGRCAGGFAVLALEGVTDRNAAEALRGCKLYVDRAHARTLGEDENFICDLIGLRAEDTQGRPIGTLREVLRPNAVCDVYAFDTPRGEMLMPALRRAVARVDVEGGVIVLDEQALSEVAVWQNEPSPRDDD